MQSIPEISVDVQVLAVRMGKAAMAEVIPYAELSGLVKRDVQHGGAGILQTAKKLLLREKNMVFAPVRAVGIKRLDDAGIVSIGEQAVRAIHRKSSRTARKIACADYEKLSQHDKIRFNTHLSLLGAMKLATQSSRVKSLSDAVSKAAQQLPSADVLQLFAK